MKRGTIVLTKFPFTDLSSSKRRPALVLTEAKIGSADVIVAFISSVIPAQPGDTELVFDKTHPNFADSGLIKKSVFKMQKLATLNSAIFTGELGEVSDMLMSELEIRLKKALYLT